MFSKLTMCFIRCLFVGTDVTNMNGKTKVDPILVFPHGLAGIGGEQALVTLERPFIVDSLVMAIDLISISNEWTLIAKKQCNIIL